MKNIIFVACTMMSCMNNNESNEDFSVFHKRFYADSLFQKSRIHYPLDGCRNIPPKCVAWEEVSMYFLKKKPLSDYVVESDYIENIYKKDSIYVEEIYLKDSDYNVQKHFKQIRGKWFLVYLLD